MSQSGTYYWSKIDDLIKYMAENPEKNVHQAAKDIGYNQSNARAEFKIYNGRSEPFRQENSREYKVAMIELCRKRMKRFDELQDKLEEIIAYLASIEIVFKDEDEDSYDPERLDDFLKVQKGIGDISRALGKISDSQATIMTRLSRFVGADEPLQMTHSLDERQVLKAVHAIIMGVMEKYHGSDTHAVEALETVFVECDQRIPNLPYEANQ